METTSDDGNVTAFWIVHKIRHRDEQRSFRYELKITVKRVQHQRSDGKRDLNHNIVNSRSFLLRDDDYPEFFAEASTKHDVKLMDKRIFNTVYDNSEVPFRLSYRSKVLASYPPFDSNNNLNIGEYFSPTTNSLQSKPSNIVQQQEYAQAPKPSIEKFSDFQQNYFLNKNDYTVFKPNNYRKIVPYSINNANAAVFPGADQQHPSSDPLSFRAVQRLEILDTSSQAPVQFPDANTNRNVVNPTAMYRNPYDDNRASILDGGVNNNQPQIFAYSHSPTVGAPKANAHAHIPPTSYPYETNTSPSNALFRNPNSVYGSGLQPNFPYQSDDKPYWYGYSNIQQPTIQANFIPSQRYENTYSELDPVYHNPTILVTPVNLLPLHLQHLNSPTTDTNPRTIAQLPIEAIDINSPTENYRSPAHQINGDPGFTTPLSYSTSVNSEIPQLNSDAHYYPDSINAQLPPPESDSEIPYVEPERRPTETLFEPNRTDDHRSSEYFLSTEKYDRVKSSEYIPKKSFERVTPPNIVSLRKQVKPTTTQASPTTTTFLPETTTFFAESTTVKRARNRGSTKFEVSTKKTIKSTADLLATRRRRLKINKPTTTTTEPFTSTTTTDINDFNDHNEITTTILPIIDYEPRTSQSVQKTVSVRVGDQITVMPKQTTTSSVSSRIKRKRITTRKLIKPNGVENTTETASAR